MPRIHNTAYKPFDLNRYLCFNLSIKSAFKITTRFAILLYRQLDSNFQKETGNFWIKKSPTLSKEDSAFSGFRGKQPVLKKLSPVKKNLSSATGGRSRAVGAAVGGGKNIFAAAMSSVAALAQPDVTVPASLTRRVSPRPAVVQVWLAFTLPESM
jgi:hypothetical protein